MNRFKFNEAVISLGAGYSFRTKVEAVPDGDLAVIQMRDLTDEYSRVGESVDFIIGEDIHPKYLLEKGDILFLAKGVNNVALVYEGLFERAIASSTFFVIRPNTEVVTSAYLAWYLNSGEAQKHFLENRVGTSTQNVNRATLESIEIKVPERKLQEDISKLSFLSLREYLLVNEINERRKTLMSYQILKILENYD
ncbi:MAG: hypothetical protein COW03_13410 [Cytophagales bacterium CG12_big_fil_rev_8_21_14_0_65_40_12]|nr:MAG: hypothetical protein COW03_13410 [Cytophagales bacterium CG12_big_fil_rev_8_21_14_0_65_40_12]PIW03131.1 MAG: hypothetical protein COW40_17485 [Cytophagales bacterium CG17_big_fil_post_rev_8_21_14_2_50_40_13]